MKVLIQYLRSICDMLSSVEDTGDTAVSIHILGAKSQRVDRGSQFRTGNHPQPYWYPAVLPMCDHTRHHPVTQREGQALIPDNSTLSAALVPRLTLTKGPTKGPRSERPFLNYESSDSYQSTSSRLEQTHSFIRLVIFFICLPSQCVGIKGLANGFNS